MTFSGVESLWVGYGSENFSPAARLDIRKKVKEKSRECNNHKPQPFPDTKRKRKRAKQNSEKQE